MATATKSRAKKVEESGRDIHQMVRALGARDLVTESGDEVYSVDTVDAHIRNWLDAGYELFYTHYLGPVYSSGNVGNIVGYRVLYVFVK